MVEYKNLQGLKFGKLTAIKLSEDKFDSNKTTKLWECKCECGNIVYKSARHLNEILKKGSQTGCGCTRYLEYINKKFGDLVVKKYLYSNKKTRFWLCECCCGDMIIKSSTMLLKNNNLCSKKKKDKLKYIHRIRNIYYLMKQRCYNPKDDRYKNYGERGIKICDEWLNDINSFINWSLNNGYKPNLEIDRIDNDKGYSPENCRWVDDYVQANNTTRVLKIEYEGKTQSLRKWCRELSLPYRKTHKRLFTYNWTVEKCFDHSERVGFI
jgi:hypothetical protein